MSSDRFGELAAGCKDWSNESSLDEFEIDSDNDLSGLPGICHSDVVVRVCQINTSGDYWNDYAG